MIFLHASIVEPGFVFVTDFRLLHRSNKRQDRQSDQQQRLYPKTWNNCWTKNEGNHAHALYDRDHFGLFAPHCPHCTYPGEFEDLAGKYSSMAEFHTRGNAG